MNVELLIKDLVRDEGLRQKPYRDSVGKLTIGVGRNLDDVGITVTEAYYLLRNDIEAVKNGLELAFPWYKDLSEPRQRALSNMTFNLGLTRLMNFKKMLSAFVDGDFERAANEALDSRWAKQVGGRSTRIADMIRRG